MSHVEPTDRSEKRLYLILGFLVLAAMLASIKFVILPFFGSENLDEFAKPCQGTCAKRIEGFLPNLGINTSIDQFYITSRNIDLN